VWRLVDENDSTAADIDVGDDFSCIHTIRHLLSAFILRPCQQTLTFFHVSTAIIITTRVNLFLGAENLLL
jgi:hypothetical protein